MASVVGIANRAIQKVGAQRILALTDNQREARSVNACYDAVREALLRRYRWKFAKKRVVLAADVAAPVFGYAYQVTLPADCLRVLLPSESCAEDQRVEGRKILVNRGWHQSGNGAMYALEYISDVVDPNLMDASFRECLAQKIAIEIADELTASVSRKANLKDEWKEVYAEAVQADSFEDPPIDATPDTWITARVDGFGMGERWFPFAAQPVAPTPVPIIPVPSTVVLGLDGMTLYLDGAALSLV